MFNPLTPDLTKLTDTELQEKLNTLGSRIITAYRLGNSSMVMQLQQLQYSYNEESQRRLQAKMASAEEKGKGFKGLINIGKQ